MNAEERKALRAKHTMRYEGYEGPHVCRGCGNHRARVPYPCDAIKTLDAYEKLVADCKQLIKDLPQETVALYWADYVKDKW